MSKNKSSGKANAVIFAIILTIITVLAAMLFMQQKSKSEFIIEHKDEYTSYNATLSNVSYTKHTHKKTSKHGRGRRRTTTTTTEYEFKFNMNLNIDGKDYTIYGGNKTYSSSNALSEGDTMAIIVRDGAETRSFDGEYDWLYGSIESNTDMTTALVILILFCGVDVIFVAVLVIKGIKNNKS